ncbi:glucose-6-phosphate isomerase [Brevibacillus daliensis]|uniref:glucose-6-phosphate isomerase n=1 Tax=Brevibacillus daliensis TaxID=2892995 RepID=UPI001E311E1E|nr:glucose-6-phosphate isomerase [Brevibacillus daliensis]
MNQTIRFRYDKATPFLNEHELKYMEPAIRMAHDLLHTKKGPGSDYLGWVDLPHQYDRAEFIRIKMIAEKIRNDTDVLLIIGIGGSYLGSKAVIDALGHTFYNSIRKEKRKAPEIYYVGNNSSPSYLADLVDVLEGKEVSINVISKSGTTTEPAIAFRIFREYLEKKYGKKEARKRIYATTDQTRGALRQIADEEGYETFVIPDDVGGRFSVLTAVGLLPIAVSGVDVDQLMKGAQHSCDRFRTPDLWDNECYQYAALRNLLLRKGKQIEMLVNYEPRLHYLNEWWKQLFAESEGKDGKGIFPASADLSADLHSLGQFIQDGTRNLFETVLSIDKYRCDVEIEEAQPDLDGLNFLSGKGMEFVNKKAMEGTILAHIDGGVPNLVVELPELSAYHIGELLYFFEKACGISGYLLGVNPFDQPGVEAYKTNMYALLGKPGYEKQKRELEARLQGK